MTMIAMMVLLMEIVAMLLIMIVGLLLTMMMVVLLTMPALWMMMLTHLYHLNSSLPLALQSDILKVKSCFRPNISIADILKATTVTSKQSIDHQKLSQSKASDKIPCRCSEVPFEQFLYPLEGGNRLYLKLNIAIK